MEKIISPLTRWEKLIKQHKMQTTIEFGSFNACGKCFHNWEEEKSTVCPNCGKKFESVKLKNTKFE